MASITMRNLILYTTNENWRVVNLKEAREFSSDKEFIYVFKKLEWESLSVDLLPHPDMFADVQGGANHRDDNGISGEAYITVQRTELNSPLGLEVQLHITEAVCPALSEPGLRALLRFFTGLYLCLNRGNVDPKAQQRSAEAAGRSLVSIIVDHIFLCIKDAEFQLELLMQSLCFSRKWQLIMGVPLRCIHSLQVKPSPFPPSFASQTVIECQPLMIHLQEQSCLRISSFLADGIVVNPGAVLPDSSVNSLVFTLKDLDISVPLDTTKLDNPSSKRNLTVEKSLAGARLHIEKLFFSESPSLKLKLLNLEKDPACFCLWEGQPIDASQKKWTAGASQLSLYLETSASLTGLQSYAGRTSGLWRCVEVKDASGEVAMVSADGNPSRIVPHTGGVVRVWIACHQYLSNTSVEQLFFCLGSLYILCQSLMGKVPSDTAVSLTVNDLQLRFLESSSSFNIHEMPLVQFIGRDLFIKVTHRTLGGAIAVSSTLFWEWIEVDCLDNGGNLVNENQTMLDSVENGSLVTLNGYPPLRPVFWVDNKKKHQSNGKAFVIPFLDISIVHVIPFNEQDKECHSLMVSASISGVRLGGGMNYTEAWLHRFGILGPDGGPGEGLSKGLENLSAGPLAKLLKPSALIDDLAKGGNLEGEKDSGFLHLGMPDDVDVSIELKDWLFALEGVQETADRWWFDNQEDVTREERCWHTTFQTLRVKATSSPKHMLKDKGRSDEVQKYPVELVTVGVEGLQTLKPQVHKGLLKAVHSENGFKEGFETSSGGNLEVRLVISENNDEDEMANWVIENLRFSVKQPIEAIVTKDELQHLALLCKSEVDSMGRITAGILRLLKLEKSIGRNAIDKLGKLGTEGFEKIFSRNNLSRGGSAGSTGQSPRSYVTHETPRSTLASTVASLKEAVLDSQAKCTALITNLSSSESPEEHLANIRELSQKLESMQSLLVQLQSHI
ncbi:hypothetical protein SLE2022_395530 [Rubroshorea leprosula]